MKTFLTVVVAVTALVTLAGVAISHCEIPCGIYGDKMRVLTLEEHFTTVEKSMKMIREIGGQEKPEYNQLVRWVSNKDKHADEIQHIVTQYFMTQRVKVPAGTDSKAREVYVTQVTLLHQLLVSAMKMKQTTDAQHVANARKLLGEFCAAYFSAEDLKHLKAAHDK